MAGTLDIHPLEIGYPSLHAQRLLGPQHEVEFGGYHQRRLTDMIGQVGRLLPVAIDIAIPVESAAKASFLKGPDVDVEVGLGHKFAEWPVGQAIDQTAAGRT